MAMSECPHCGCDREYAERLCAGLQDRVRELEAINRTMTILLDRVGPILFAAQAISESHEMKKLERWVETGSVGGEGDR